MIIQCVKCQTKFRLDDSKITEKGVKVRCTKCKHVFTVQKDEPKDMASAPEEIVTGTASADIRREEVVATTSFQNVPEPVQATPFNSDIFESTSFSSQPAEPGTSETSSINASSSVETLSSKEPVIAENTHETTTDSVVKGGEVDFSSFDFGDSDSTPVSDQLDDFADAMNGPAITTPVTAAPKEPTVQGLDFSDDDMFGAVVQATPESPCESITFDFEGDSFADSMDMNSQDSSGKSGAMFSADTAGDAPFSLGEIDFGDELTAVAVQQINPEDLKPSQESLFAPLAKAQAEEITKSFLADEPLTSQQELPPLSISSRRKQNPLSGRVIALVAVLVVACLGYVGYSSLSTSKEASSIEVGKISVQAVKAAYVKNSGAGELLVISGEAVNEYSKPRAALQVKVSVTDGTGQSAATKTAYCGNPLTREQLQSLPLDKIEAAMANQFGDSLANMEVAPGKGIPFLVVLANLPKGARDFVTQPAGSTVATGKQQ